MSSGGDDGEDVRAHPLFRAVFEGAHEALWFTDDEGRFLDVNPAGCALLGRTRDDLVGRAYLDVFEPPSQPELDRLVERLGRDGGGVGRMRARRPDGTVRETEFRTYLHVASGLHLTTTRDVTEQAAAERALRETEHRLETLVATAPVILAAFDRDGTITVSLGRGLELLGVAQGELVGQNVHDLYGALPGVREMLDRVWNGEPTAWGGEPDGGSGALEAHVFPTRDPQGQVTGALAIAIDVSERRRAEERLQRSQKMEAIAQLAGGVAHDFNNLLSVVLSYAAMLAGDLAEDDPRREDVLEIRRAGERAAKLTRQLLALGRRQKREVRVLDPTGVVSDLERMMRRYVGEDVVLELHARERLPAIEVDPGQLEQVLVNLVVNARDAMPDGGTLTISIDRCDVGPDAARGNDVAPGDYVRLSVTDTGVGMDDEVRARIFEPFFTTKPHGQGSGLGLSTVFGLVRQNRGLVEVQSAPGAGSTFHVLFPASAAAPAPVSRAPGPTPTLTGDETVLLVEDDDAVRNALAAGLRRHGYQVLHARNAGEALLLAEREGDAIDLVVTDVVMPYLGGPALAARLAQSHPGLRVLLMSGHAPGDLVPQEVVDEGRFLAKPVTPDTLVARVRAVLDRS